MEDWRPLPKLKKFTFCSINYGNAHSVYIYMYTVLYLSLAVPLPSSSFPLSLTLSLSPFLAYLVILPQYQGMSPIGTTGPVDGGGMWGLGGIPLSGPSKLSNSYTSLSSLVTWSGGGGRGVWYPPPWCIGGWAKGSMTPPGGGAPPTEEGRAPAGWNNKKNISLQIILLCSIICMEMVVKHADQQHNASSLIALTYWWL